MSGLPISPISNDRVADPRLHVIGAGGHARVVIATARRLGLDPVGLFDDDPATHGRRVDGVLVLESVSRIAAHPPLPAVLAIGDNRTRQRLASELDLEWQTLVHPMALVEENATVGAGTIVMAGAVVQPGSVVGRHVIVNTGASVDHDCRVGDYCHVAPGVHLSGGVILEEGALLGVGSAVVAERRVGRWAVVGAGAAVVKDLPEETVAVGVPARPLTRGPA